MKIKDLMEENNRGTFEYRAYEKSMSNIGDMLYRLERVLKKDSIFSKKVEKFGGDMKILESARKHLNELSDEIADLEMDVDMAQGEDDR